MKKSSENMPSPNRLFIDGKGCMNLGTAEVQRIKQLENENRKLKQLAGDQALAIQILQEHIKKKGY
jgi:hypothetical protein